MRVMRRGETWSFVVWVRDGEGARQQVWRGGYRLARDAVRRIWHERAAIGRAQT